MDRQTRGGANKQELETAILSQQDLEQKRLLFSLFLLVEFFFSLSRFKRFFFQLPANGNAIGCIQRNNIIISIIRYNVFQVMMITAALGWEVRAGGAGGGC